ncbi:MAG: hypothetical protein JXR89_00390, partial [Deltaproteobacteria bacterium]|nr:hypothetical protein [Deltaproteobacteria bacterium]
MSVNQLEKIFNPRIVAVVADSHGHDLKTDALLANLARTAPPRRVYLVGGESFPLKTEFQSAAALADIREDIDLLFLMPPLSELPPLLSPKVLSRTAAVVINKNITSSHDREILDQLAAAAIKTNTRLLGVNSSGILRPSIQLNLSTHPQLPQSGKIAFFSQSGAVLSTIIDLARELEIGFSHVAGIGSLLDVDFGDLIDFVGDDPEVEAIVLYLENIRNVKKFISACRSVSRSKPIIAIKSGRHPRIHEVMQRRVFSRIGDGPVYDSA